MRPPSVHSVKRTSATRLGETKCAARGTPDPANGLAACSSGASRPARRSSSSSVNPVPDLPRVLQRAGAVVVADQQRADATRSPALARGPPAHHELLAQLVLDLAPRRRPAPRLVGRVDPLGHDALQPELPARRRARRHRRRCSPAASAISRPASRGLRAGAAARGTGAASGPGRRATTRRRPCRPREPRGQAIAGPPRRARASGAAAAESSAGRARRARRSRRRATLRCHRARR